MNETPAAAPAGSPDTPGDVRGDVPGDIVVYWRPGCPFCGGLFRQLDQAGVAHRRVNIWDDPEGAAVVRSIARGNETVPTVVVDGVGLVNPNVSQILAVAARA